MRKNICLVLTMALSLVATAAWSGEKSPTSAQEVFDQLKTLDGTWSGIAKGEGEAAGEPREVTHEFTTTAGGSVVMEVMQPGTDHEMINMYHLDGDQLVVTHYCAGGNQPLMKLDAAALTEGRVEFDFAGGTNLDASKDGHIHSGSFSELGQDRLQSSWTSWYQGEQAGVMTFTLQRQD